jgi:Flp pilus assembly pilin Flp
MDHDLGKDPPRRGFAAAEKGGAAIETALLAALAAFLALTVKHTVATPLLAILTKASRVLSQALGG